jgi:starch synthase
VRLFMPFYSQIKRDKVGATRVESLQGLALRTGSHEYRVDIWRAILPGSTTPVYPGGVDALYARPASTPRPGRTSPFPDLTHAALECCRRMNFRPHIVHSHDWHTAFAPLWLRSIYKHDPVFAAPAR